MKKKKILLLLVLAAAVFCLTRPRIQADLFTALFSRSIEENLENGNGFPAGLPGLRAGYYEGEHPMYQFGLWGRGLVANSVYYGCYYSPEDVPLCLDNAKFPLISHGENAWTWQGEGDNGGRTEKIKDKWYYFEAHF